ncbi:HHIP-like protein 1 [Gracilariopsis chorda]|uniref:HHIP-like protein 1 n=1 Tax=Gracilariopsis chorda TaxID=448386 RepID=A0A2V3IP19_9FLOR|nr:HHIP-like protein 1 [Gracilariopsis chorda]|eukprot:PXF43799.1 HHIP-like protein 1 [Gracilariopsis chorda]
MGRSNFILKLVCFLPLFLPLIIVVVVVMRGFGYDGFDDFDESEPPISGNLFNPVRKPIVKHAMDVYMKRFAKIPDEDGKTAAINCLVPLVDHLFICTRTKIYEVSPKGRVNLFLDVDAAIKVVTGRSLSIENLIHGGVRSVAFHPSFSENGFFYVSAMEERPSNPRGFNYISDVSNHIDADSVLIEWRTDLTSGKPLINSYRNLFRIGMPVYDHPIKQIAFYEDLLYIAHGDGSVQSAVAGGGQTGDCLGKILRINPLQAGSRPYTIPGDNPFLTNRKFPGEVYAIGFRNPHHICFGRDGTLYAADTGRANIEEVNIVKSGSNYGWAEREGTFVHTGGGLMSGVDSLPADDAKNDFTYPAAQVGHEGPFNAAFIGQAIAGGCPIENGSPMSGHYYYADFPISGKLYFSRIPDLRKAKTEGDPAKLTQATTYQANIIYDGKRYKTLGAAMRSEEGFSLQRRVDVRFGRGSSGELYWSSKRNGRIYLFTSSLPGGKGGPTY